MEGYVVFPAFCDVHVHFREPGFEYKETIESGSCAAARGGYTDVCTMPNLKPCPDSMNSLKIQLKKIEDTAMINVHPYGTITKGQEGEELSDMEEIAPFVCAFSDDGRGVQRDALMEEAMKKAKSLGKMIVAHCEVNELLRGGYIHDGEYARLHGHRGICSESEWQQIARDIELVKKTGVAYHVCHISTAESVEIIRKAKAEGVDITCETAPHYLILNDMDLEEDARFKMNPPIRSERDRLALVEGLCDGTIDMIATDHAPHSLDEKSRGLEKSLMGVVGLETAFAIMYTYLVKTGVISLEKLVEVMAINPRKRFGFSMNKNDLTVFDLNCEYEINPADFKSNGKSSPFTGTKVFGKCVATFSGGKLVWREDK
ncbi:MAG: dihydroorotase [Clostridia bacterium]|nr:dihydroorotase [Clostridia bacterium]